MADRVRAEMIEFCGDELVWDDSSQLSVSMGGKKPTGHAGVSPSAATSSSASSPAPTSGEHKTLSHILIGVFGIVGHRVPRGVIIPPFADHANWVGACVIAHSHPTTLSLETFSNPEAGRSKAVFSAFVEGKQ